MENNDDEEEETEETEDTSNPKVRNRYTMEQEKTLIYQWKENLEGIESQKSRQHEDHTRSCKQSAWVSKRPQKHKEKSRQNKGAMQKGKGNERKKWKIKDKM